MNAKWTRVAHRARDALAVLALVLLCALAVAGWYLWKWARGVDGWGHQVTVETVVLDKRKGEKLPAVVTDRGVYLLAANGVKGHPGVTAETSAALYAGLQPGKTYRLTLWRPGFFAVSDDPRLFDMFFIVAAEPVEGKTQGAARRPTR